MQLQQLTQPTFRAFKYISRLLDLIFDSVHLSSVTRVAAEEECRQGDICTSTSGTLGAGHRARNTHVSDHGSSTR